MKMRVIATKGIHNFRDYGGYASVFGGQVKSGLLFRSGQHREATADDLEAVSALNLAAIIDLRSDSERALYPCARPADHRAEVLYVPGNTLGLQSHVDAAHGVRTADEAHTAMLELYRKMPFRPILTATYQLFFNRLASDDGASLIHCLAGKDRTGLGVALVHHILGVHRDDMMADYLLTNSVGDMESRIAAGAEAVRANFGQDMDDAAVRTLMSVDAAFLDAAMEEIGDMDCYCRDVLDVTDAKRAAILQNLLA